LTGRVGGQHEKIKRLRGVTKSLGIVGEWKATFAPFVNGSNAVRDQGAGISTSVRMSSTPL
jgi:hypothetical protein